MNTTTNSDDADKNKGMAIAACFIFFLPLLTDARHSPFAMHWANQSLLRVFVHIGAMALLFIPILGWMLFPFVQLFAVVLFILSLVWAAQGKMKPLPIVGGYTVVKAS
jgi:uncharacterized membrane protein